LEPLIIVKFGGSALGIDGIKIPTVIDRIKELKENAKIVSVFSAPLTN
jgi:aspartate kinase